MERDFFRYIGFREKELMRGILKGVNFWLGTRIKWRFASETLSETYRKKSIWRVVREAVSKGRNQDLSEKLCVKNLLTLCCMVGLGERNKGVGNRI